MKKVLFITLLSIFAFSCANEDSVSFDKNTERKSDHTIKNGLPDIGSWIDVPYTDYGKPVKVKMKCRRYCKETGCGWDGLGEDVSGQLWLVKETWYFDSKGNYLSKMTGTKYTPTSSDPCNDLGFFHNRPIQSEPEIVDPSIGDIIDVMIEISPKVMSHKKLTIKCKKYDMNGNWSGVGVDDQGFYWDVQSTIMISILDGKEIRKQVITAKLSKLQHPWTISC